MCGTGALERVLAAQRLDELDVEGAHMLLHALLRRGAPHDDAELRTGHGRASGEPPHEGEHGGGHAHGAVPAEHALEPTGCSEAASAAELALPVHAGPDCGLNPELDQNHGAGPEAAHAAELARLRALPLRKACAALRGYLTAATAKDCSLMLTLQALPGAGRPGVVKAVKPLGHGLPAANAAACAQSHGLRRPPAEHDSTCTGDRVLANSDACGPAVVVERQTDACEGGIVELDGPGGRRARLRYKLAVVDLDLKRLAKVEAHWRLDQRILEVVGESRANC